jgi:BirA family transcriptional regulator, biotin operon repressor / biotin---[acetyl-CoA-carboxylase] ligase
VQIDERVRAHLAATTRFTDLEVLAVTDSTNRVAADRAGQGAPEGLVVVADLQTAGRGRLDRSWEAAAGTALLVSVLLRPVDLPPPRWHLLTTAAGLAAREACAEVAGFVPELKWPNDLLFDDRKLAGILAEATSEAVVVGMGCNVHGGPPGSAWMDEAAARRIDRGTVLVAWLTSLDRLLGRWDEVAATYSEVCATVGRQVVVERGGDRVAGLAERIDSDGRLVVRLDRGAAVAVAAGDVIHVRTAG